MNQDNQAPQDDDRQPSDDFPQWVENVESFFGVVGIFLFVLVVAVLTYGALSHNGLI